MNATPSLSTLFVRFLKLGATAYGGPAMIGQIRRVVVNEYGWLKEEDFLQGLAFIQTIPGGSVPQMAAYAGYRLRGVAGAVTSMAAYLIPPFFTLVVLSVAYFKTRNLWFTNPLFTGLSAIAAAIVLDACLTLGKPILRDWQAVLIAVLSFAGLFVRLNILVILIGAGFMALLLYKKEKTGAAPGGFEGTRPGMGKEELCLLGVVFLVVCSVFAASYLVDPQLTYLSLRLAKIGALMFGGGFTVIPLIQYEVVDQFHWIGTKEFLDGIALGQLTPGPMMITAFIGNAHSGLFGAVAATDRAYVALAFHPVAFAPLSRLAEERAGPSYRGTRHPRILCRHARACPLRFRKNGPHRRPAHAPCGRRFHRSEEKGRSPLRYSVRRGPFPPSFRHGRMNSKLMLASVAYGFF